MMVPVLKEVKADEAYEGDGFTMRREDTGLTPNGNPIHGQWVLRRDGAWIDFDGYRNDLAERNNLKLVSITSGVNHV